MLSLAGMLSRVARQSCRYSSLFSTTKGSHPRGLTTEWDGDSTTSKEHPGTSEDSEASTSSLQGSVAESSKHGRRWNPNYSGDHKQPKFPIKITNFPRCVIRRDLIRLLDPLDIVEENVRPAFDEQLRPMSFWINLPTEHYRRKALKYDGRWLGTKQVRIVAGSPADMSREITSRYAMASRGRYVLVSGFRANEVSEDVMKLFEGFRFMNHACNIFRREIPPAARAQKRLPSEDEDTQGQAVVRFADNLEAQRAMRHCAQGFVGNRKITLRVLP